jgi:hypothetical protein
MTDQELKDLVAGIAKETMRETDLILKENALQMKETDRMIQEVRAAQKETDRQIKETAVAQKETALQMKETDRRWEKMSEKWDDMKEKVSGINDNIGHHAEQFFQDIFAETLTFAGKKYDKMIPNLECKGKVPCGEFDIVLVNGKDIAIIEAKNRIHPNYLKKLVEEKVAQFRRFFPEYKNRKLYLGIAGFSFSKTVPEIAKKYGVGIIKQVGKSIEVEAQNLRAY